MPFIMLRNDFPAAAIFHCRFLTLFSQLNKNSKIAEILVLIYKTKINTHLHQKSELYFAFINRSQQMFMPALGWRVRYHFQSHCKILMHRVLRYKQNFRCLRLKSNNVQLSSRGTERVVNKYFLFPSCICRLTVLSLLLNFL